MEVLPDFNQEFPVGICSILFPKTFAVFARLACVVVARRADIHKDGVCRGVVREESASTSPKWAGQRCDPGSDLDPLAVHCEPLRLHLPDAARQSIGVSLGNCMQGSVEPPPLLFDLALQVAQLSSSSTATSECVPFCSFSATPLDAARKLRERKPPSFRQVA